MEKPAGYEKELSDYKEVAYDGWCGKPVAWGFELLSYLGDHRFNALRQHGELKCLGLEKWVLVVKSLTREEAIQQYGEITNEEFGPKGGWRSVTFGDKKFMSPYLKPSRK